MKKFLLAILAVALITLLISAAQFGIIKGIVLDENGKPVIGASVRVIGTPRGTYVKNKNGSFIIQNVPVGNYKLIVNAVGYEKYRMSISVAEGKTEEIKIVLVKVTSNKDEVKVYGSRVMVQNCEVGRKTSGGYGALNGYAPSPYPAGEFNTEQYDRIYDNEFKEALTEPLSTFSIDVDKASYSNVRRFINGGSLPPEDAVRTEELINYFTYDYPEPRGDEPFAIYSEIAECPWNKDHKLIHIGLQGKKVPLENIPPGNLVFLIDVSGSMQDYNKLPLVKSALRLLVEQLRAQDKVAICVYAGAAGLVLNSTPGGKKTEIIAAIEQLEAGGSTAGAEGIKLAYEVAKKNLIQGGNNRVILATDGDFNVGVSSDGELTRMIEDRRDDGIYLTVLGFGMGNYKDSKMEKLADKGNGNYAYIDNMLEAKKMFVNELGGTLFTIAKDVKIQIEFNPGLVKEYRLIGYENRLLNKEDFNDDKKDAGELGSGHTVTALYEIIPNNGSQGNSWNKIDPLKYQTTNVNNNSYSTDEIATVKFRYKEPDGTKSKLIVNTLKNADNKLSMSSENLRFASAVTEFAMLLRKSKFVGTSTFDEVIKLATGARGQDREGYRAEFIRLVEATKALSVASK
ncbi:MAG: von Willebrand factor type A domain-containing protein [Ignavibacteriae bacterium]|nr:von Willebrand factor type A domain-containing protein [Ignavibacteriota bacterium]